MSLDVTHIEEAVFFKIRDVNKVDTHFAERLQQQLTKCKLNAPSPPAFPHFPSPGGGRGGRGSSSYGHNTSHHHFRGPVNANGRGGHHHHHHHYGSHQHLHYHGHSRQRQALECVHGSGQGHITGLLNKVSPKNIQDLAAKIVLHATGTSINGSAKTIIEHGLKQPSYMSMFIRLLSELSACRCGARNEVVLAVESVVQSHLANSFLDDLPPASPQTDYDAFCARIKAVKRLLGMVSFVVGCIRSRLVDAIDMRDYADCICRSLDRVADTHDLETMLEVIETFLETSGWSSADFQTNVAAWADTLKDRNLLTPRARFKLMDIL